MEQAAERVEKRVLNEGVKHQPRIRDNKKQTAKVYAEVGNKKTEVYRGPGYDGTSAMEKIVYADARQYAKNIVNIKREMLQVFKNVFIFYEKDLETNLNKQDMSIYEYFKKKVVKVLK